MIKRNQRDLVAALTANEGYRFCEFELETTSNCEISDSDWNYKDIPHLKHIHKLVEGYPGYAGDDFISAILVQKVFGFKFPAVLFNYGSGTHRQTYYITMLWYLLIVETRYESLAPNRTKTTTRYAIGCRSWLASLLFPLCRLAIKRNFADLMSGDLPMRERRGELRTWGYTFKGDGKPYSFFETSLIAETNVVPPVSGLPGTTHVLKLNDLREGSRALVGKSDQFGLSIHVKEGLLSAFPRLCPHEGSDMSDHCDGRKARCEWHGRVFGPEFGVPLSDLRPGYSKQFGSRYRLRCPADGVLELVVAPMNGATQEAARTDRAEL